MTLDEQEQRMQALRAMVAEFNVYRWAGRMLLDATSLRQHDRLSVRLADAWHASEARDMKPLFGREGVADLGAV